MKILFIGHVCVDQNVVRGETKTPNDIMPGSVLSPCPPHR